MNFINPRKSQDLLCSWTVPPFLEWFLDQGHSFQAILLWENYHIPAFFKLLGSHPRRAPRGNSPGLLQDEGTASIGDNVDDHQGLQGCSGKVGLQHHCDPVSRLEEVTLRNCYMTSGSEISGAHKSFEGFKLRRTALGSPAWVIQSVIKLLASKLQQVSLWGTAVSLDMSPLLSRHWWHHAEYPSELFYHWDRLCQCKSTWGVSINGGTLKSSIL